MTDKPILLSTRALLPQMWHRWARKIRVQEFMEMADWTGYWDVSFMPVGAMRKQLQEGQLDTWSAGLIEQPFMCEEDTRKKLAYLWTHKFDPKGLSAALLVSWPFVMGRRESLPYLAKLAQNGNVPAVIYPYHAPRLPEYDSVNLGGVLWNENPYPEFEKFPVRLVRPTNGLKADDFWAFDNPKDFWKIAQQYGYTGISLNIGDLLSMFPQRWSFALWHWLEHVQVVEIDANRLSEPEYVAVLGHFRKSSAKLVIYRIPGKHNSANSFFNRAAEVRREALSIICRD